MELLEICDIEIDIDEEIPVCAERLAGENSYESEEIIIPDDITFADLEEIELTEIPEEPNTVEVEKQNVIDVDNDSGEKKGFCCERCGKKYKRKSFYIKHDCSIVGTQKENKITQGKVLVFLYVQTDVLMLLFQSFFAIK